MIRGIRSSRRWSALVLAVAVGLLQGCGDKTTGNTSPTPSITVTLSPTSASVQQGGSTTVTATVTGAGGFTGIPLVSITGAPTGVTGALSNVQTSGSTTTATVTLNVAATTTPGTYTITVNASGSGVSSVTTTFNLTVTAAPASSYALALSPTTLSVAQGASGTAAVNITRTNFTGEVALAVTGAPTGVTATLSPTSTTGNSSTLTVTAASSATVGSATLTITGTATGAANQTVTLPLTITAVTAGNYTLSASPASVAVTQGGAAATSTINITRTGGFAGSVALAVTGAPTGVTATLNPTSTTGNTSTLTVTAAAGATTGNATLTITGTATGLANQTTTVGVTVSASGGTGNVVVDFSTCAAANKPIWLAFQNGTSGWTQVTNVGDVYRFTINQSKGGIAYTTQSASGATAVTVQYLTQAEVTAGTLTFCGVVGGKTLTGTVAGLASGDAVIISMGGATASVAANGAYTLAGVATGNQDLVAYRSNLLSPGATDKVIIRRDQNIAAGGAIPVLDFGAAEAFNPATGTATITGAGSDQIVASMAYYVGACVAASLSTNPFASASFTMRGIPAAQQRASDYHQIAITAINGTTSFRQVLESFHTMADKTFALGVALPTPTVTILPAAYKRLQAAVTLPSDYQSAMTMTYSASTKAAVVTATFGWLGGATATLAFPDFAGVTGWQDSWVPATGTTVAWTVGGFGSTITSTAGICTEGARLKSAFVTGSI